MKPYSEHLQRITSAIENASFGEYPDELYAPIRYMMSLGGKRLRPVLTLMACELFGADSEKAVPAALAVEVFHNFTLVHDDIMDNAPLRRGKETVYKKWSMPVAILAGDLMMIKATDFLCETDTPRLKELISLFNTTAREVCEGQQIDMNFETQSKVSHNEYIHMITLKTAVLLGAALKLGALVAGASKEDAERIYAFGKNTGIAFQIQDDILDSFGDGSLTGKKVGGDIASNKKTLLLIELMESVHKDDKKDLEVLLSLPDSPEKINGVLNLYHKYQIRDFAEQKKQAYFNSALTNLAEIQADEAPKQTLKAMAINLMERLS
ncbi:MAG: polyprenyl synthetase family protein [Bacteroidetes bacterium]|nr:polyprenyl synthetase family protein [Bacteroidota bacterium]